MIRIQIFIFTLLLTHYTQASQTDFKARLQDAITQHSEEPEESSDRQAIAAALDFLAKKKPEQQIPPRILKTLKRLKLASEENDEIYPEALEEAPKIKCVAFGTGTPPLYYCYLLTN